MIPEIGHFALVLALCASLLLAGVPALGYALGHQTLLASANRLALIQMALVSVSFACLAAAFLGDDFSVAIVALQSNTQLPTHYKFTALWGGHEGSLLLWVLILAGWTAAVALTGKHIPLSVKAVVLATMGAIAVGFISFMLFTSNPFDRELIATPADGQDLNPLLQDPGMVIHPPMLYFGYVGFSVAFAFAIAALVRGRLDASWARWARPWTNIAWAFLTAGITLGSWWAYYELGWGGWWFWDPVENASFMPWLVGTALVHSLAVTEKRGAFKNWTLLLAIFAFSLSLLGTFLVRSGVLTSVHSFASDPTRGLYILGFLLVVVGGSLTLYALRAPESEFRPTFAKISRESLLLANNILLVCAALVVLLGTLFPLVMDYLGLGKYSVGPPYFNAMFVPLACALALLTGFGMFSQWKRTRGLKALVREPLVLALLVALLLPFAWGEWQWLAAFGLFFGLWLVFASVRSVIQQTRTAASWSKGFKRLKRSYLGMILAHVGFGVAVMGVTVVSLYSSERDLRMAAGDSLEVGSYRVEFRGTSPVTGPNYAGTQGDIRLWSEGREIARLLPEKRRYHARGEQVMTEAGIDAGLLRDVYVALGEPLGDAAWAVRVHYKPLVRWIWLGGALVALGGLLAVTDKRYRLQRLREEV
ncbi:heme lyase CcmF/NrfE family subunit [Litorivivens sp.]|uniref:heme lyase CcmF/NrfE family subunit n=1 Tax=Litorivivens sp. TaxID=2020868 RepID=UPI003561E7B9